MLEAEQLSEKLKERFGAVRVAANNWLRIPCPTCALKDKRKMKRYVSLWNGSSKCYICTVGLTLIELLGDNFIPLRDEKFVYKEKIEDPRAKILPGSKFIPINELPLEHPAIKFLHKDYLFNLDSYYKDYEIVYCPSFAGIQFCSCPYISSADRIIFPVYFREALVGWQMRSIPGTTYGDMSDVVKYYHLFNKGSYLFNYDKASTYSTVILVEGIKKALKFPNAVASLGKNLTPTQAQLLQTTWKEIIILLDSEDKAQEIGINLAAACNRNGCTALNVNLGKYNIPSPDEATTERLLEILSYEWSQFLSERNSSTGSTSPQLPYSN